MLAHGNGTRQRCAANLVMTVAGEVPFERAKGIDRRLFDMPALDRNRVRTEASRVVSTFEPRVSSCDVTVTADDAERGGFAISLAIE